MEPQKASEFLDVIRNHQLEVFDKDLGQKSKQNFVVIIAQQIIKSLSVFNLNQNALNKLRATLLEKSTQISFIEERLFEVFASDRPSILMISSDGTIVGKSDLHATIVIDIRKVCSELLEELPCLKSSLVFESLTAREQIALKHLRNSDYNSVTIVKRKGQLDRIESRQRVSTSKRVVDMMKEADYQDIEIKQESGKAVYINRVIKTKL